MNFKKTVTGIGGWLRRQNGGMIEYDLDKYNDVLVSIINRKNDLSKKTDSDIASLSRNLIRQCKNGTNEDDLLIDAYACVYEAVRRILGMTPFDVQILGALALHRGTIAEMQTGEGKTLTAVFPAFLNALCGKGVHVLTFNDYLAGRDAAWMGPVYEFLGLSVGHVKGGMTKEQRKAVYGRDVVYLTAKEAGFDYLRDGLCFDKNEIVQRRFNYAIVDEADSILIDEARIPLVIAAERTGSDLGDLCRATASLVKDFLPEKDFQSDAYCRNLFLTENGLRRAEDALGCQNLYDTANFERLSGLYFALHAQFLLEKDKDYIVRNGAVELVDECTGRVADGRKWPQGLHTAVEAKEGCFHGDKGRILNSITLQQFILLYPKRAGMTATARQAEEEFRAFYGLPITVIPSAKKCIRKDLSDVIFKTKREKRVAIVNEIADAHSLMRPVLVGTQSVSESALVATMLQDKGLRCNVLNAKEDAREAEIIAAAGKPGSITISTNMAGRGTDIRLGGEQESARNSVIDCGGLYVIGTNRHESKRIDNQLRGRAGRQGDPGASRFFISLEDDLFEKYRLRELVPTRFFTTNKYDYPIVTREIDRIQRIIEGQHCEIKKTLCRYSVLFEQQRKIMRERRMEALHAGVDELFKTKATESYDKLLALCGPYQCGRLCSTIYLSHFDDHWSNYCEEINDLKDGIHLRRWGKQDPLFEFQKIIIDAFEKLIDNIETDAVAQFAALANTRDAAAILEACDKAPAATWTYLVNDDPLGEKFILAFANDIGFSAWAGLLWPLTALYMLFAKRKKAAAKDSDQGF